MSVGIPTMHKHRRFRSRLEARWAMFFDLCGWPYEYEPEDLKGYIPDFVLLFKEPLLAEVKPAYSAEELMEFAPKIENSGWKREALLLGGTLLASSSYPQSSIGILAEHYVNDEPGTGETWCWGLAATGRCSTCGEIGFCHEYQSFKCRPCDHYDGHQPQDVPSVLLELWAEAGNRSQWKS